MKRRILLIAVALFLPRAWADEPQPFKEAPRWTPRFLGVAQAELSATMPRLMRGQAVRIELLAPGIELLATPPASENSRTTLGLKTSTFLVRNGCQVAINGSSFAPVREEEGKEHTVDGLHISRGRMVSGGNGKYEAILFSKKNRAWFASPPFTVDEVHNAVGGFQIVLRGGKVPEKMPDYNRGTVHPRSAAGVSGDGRYLYLLAIDGRQPQWSQGATIQDVGAWLRGLGAADGINLDGGGTTTLVVADTKGQPRIVNRPIHGNRSGNERVAGSHLGVFAKPLPAP